MHVTEYIYIYIYKSVVDYRECVCVLKCEIDLSIHFQSVTQTSYCADSLTLNARTNLPP